MTDFLVSRYAALVDSPQAFSESLNTPLPGAFWIHPGKASPEAVLRNLAFHGIHAKPITFAPHAYRVPPGTPLGLTLAHLAGAIYVQEEIAMTAVAALPLSAGHSVLDMCAAPGGKSAQAALRVGNTGTVYANEFNVGRLAALGSNCARLGLTNIVGLHGDGRGVAMPYGSLDATVCDVPCSGEGTARKGRRRNGWQPPSEAFRSSLPLLQSHLLRRALHQTKCGGHLVYSTCTFDPVENEAVLNATLDSLGEIVPFDSLGLASTPGLTAWNGESLRSDLRHAVRYWPHQNDTGGFFVALIKRSDELTRRRDKDHEAPAALRWSGGSVQREALRPVLERFAVSEDFFDEFSFWEKDNGKIWMSDRNVEPAVGMDPSFVGFLAFRHADKRIWPTTSFLQFLSTRVTRNFVELTFEQGMLWARGREACLASAARENAHSGLVQVRCEGLVLGHAMLEGEVLLSQVPKALRFA